MSINPRVDRLPPDLIEGFLHVDPATVGHFIHHGFVDTGIKTLWRPVKIAGPAFTVRTLAMDTTMLHRCFEFVKAGDVLVIDGAGDRVHARFGGVVAFAAMVQKVAGVVIDGLATDIREIEEYRLPVFARGLTALTTKMWGMGGAINVPVSIGGVTVRPGDLVTADDNGILVLDPEEAPALLKRAQDAEAAEKVLKDKMRSGVCLTDLSGSKRLLDADLPALVRKTRYPS